MMKRLALARARRRVAYFWNDLHSDGVELLSATLSFSFGCLMLWNGSSSNALAYVYAFAALCFTASTCKIVGVVMEWWLLRVVGLLLGTFFWTALSGAVLLGNPHSISWLCFAVLALAQLWAVRRIMRHGG